MEYMQDCARTPCPHNGEMNEVLKGRARTPGQYLSCLIDFQDIRRSERTLVHRGSVMARRRGSPLSTALNLPPVPNTQPRE